MHKTITLDSAGRVLVPKALREALNLSAGDQMELQAEGETLTLRPIRTTSRLRKKHGMWAFSGSGRMTTEDTNKVLEDIRKQRDHDNFYHSS